MSLLTLPHDVLHDLLASLPRRDLIATRAVCKRLRQATAHPALHAARAHARWRALHPDSEPRPAAAAATTAPDAPRALEPPPIAPVASLADVEPRLVRWPARMVNHSGAPVAIAADGSLCSSGSGTILADAPFPTVFGALEADPPLPPFPFATDAACLGRPGCWALRTIAYFEVELVKTITAFSHHVSVGLCTDARRVGICVTVCAGGASAVYREGSAEASWFDGPFSGNAGERIGCGIDYATATAFFTCNGEVVAQAPHISTQAGWLRRGGVRPMVKAVSMRVRVLLGSGAAGDACFALDVLALESAAWERWRVEHQMMDLFERQFASHELGETNTRSGWPWSSTSWERAVQSRMRQWLRTHAAADGSGSRWAPSGGAAATTAATEGEDSSVGVDAGEDLRHDSPARILLHPAPDPLSVTAEDAAELTHFLRVWGLESALPALVRAGLRLPLFGVLPTSEALAAARTQGLAVGLLARLKQALLSVHGEWLGEVDRRRKFSLFPPLRFQVRLSPALPVRAAPSCDAAVLAYCATTEYVLATAFCDGWLELSAHRHGPSAWVLLDGSRVGQPAPLLELTAGNGHAQDDPRFSAARGRRLGALARGGRAALEGPRWATLAPEGQSVRVRELEGLLQLARLDGRAGYLDELLRLNLSCSALADAPRGEAVAIAALAARRWPLGHRMRLVSAVERFRGGS